MRVSRRPTCDRAAVHAGRGRGATAAIGSPFRLVAVVVFFVSAVSVLAGGAVAQHDASVLQEPAATLGSSAVEVAWSAHLARASGDRRLAAPLRKALATWSAHAGSGTDVCRHVIDALVAIDAKVPGAEVMAFVDDPGCGPAAFVLLARAAPVNRLELLELMRRDLAALDRQDTERLIRLRATGRMLADAGEADGVALLARACDFVVHVDVAHAPHRLLRRGRGSRRELPPIVAARQRAGWPPPPAYAFELPGNARPGGERCALPAEADTIVKRHVAGDARREPTSALDDGSLHDLPLQLLARAAECAEPPPMRVEIVFDAATWANDLRAARDRVQRQIDRMRTRLVARGALASDDTSLLPREIPVAIRDHRGNRRNPPVPLPDVPGVRVVPAPER